MTTRPQGLEREGAEGGGMWGKWDSGSLRRGCNASHVGWASLGVDVAVFWPCPSRAHSSRFLRPSRFHLCRSVDSSSLLISLA